MASVANSSAPFLSLPSDEIRTSLNDLKDSTDAIPPFRSAVGAVLAIWDLVDRVSAFDEHVEELARRAWDILITIYDAGGGVAGPVSAAMSDDILTFEDLLHEISAVMEEELVSEWLRSLQKRESRLAPFVARLDDASEAFKTRSAARAEEQRVPSTPDRARESQTIESLLTIPHISGGTGGSGGMGGREGGVGGPGYGPSIQAGTVVINNCQPQYERLEKFNIRLNDDVRGLLAEVRVLDTKVRALDTKVRRLEIVVLFGRSSADVRVHYSACAIAHLFR